MMRILIGSIALLAAANARAEDRGSAATVNPFTKSYWRVELVRDYPEAGTQQVMIAGNFEPAITYLHIVNGSWMMGLGLGLKVFNRIVPASGPPPPSRTLALYTLSHETLYVIRLSHPNYLLVGPKLLYLLPSETGVPPPLRDPIYQTEIGVAFSVQVVRIIDEHLLLMLRFDRWRGVNTAKLAGIEVAFGAAFAFH